jgi:uncharacterized membrane protein SpoIIM required for sporulation
MDLATFLDQRRPDWKRLEEILQDVEGSGLKSLEEAEAVEFGRLYRRAASDLNQAQTFVSGEGAERYLNDLVARCYTAIHGKGRIDGSGLLRHLIRGYSAVFRRCLPYFLLATSLFVLGAVFGFLASYYDRQMARAYLLPTDMTTIQPEEEGDDQTTPTQTTGQLAAFSSFLFTNNLSVTLVAFALGITFGIGTAWLMFYNGIMLGALAAIFIEHGQLLGFLTGIVPHGVLEIPAALLGGAAGFVIARAMIQARPWPRRDELARAGKEALLLVSGAVPLLAVAALLEAGVARAPDWFIGKGIKLAVAGVFGLLFLAWVLLPGWRRTGEAS